MQHPSIVFYTSCDASACRYDSDGLGGPDLVLLRRDWCRLFDATRIKSFINIFSYPNDGIEQPLCDIRACVARARGFAASVVVLRMP